MSNILNKQKYLLLFFAFLFVTIMIDKLDFQFQSTQPEIKPFVQKLHKKEQITNETLDSLFSHVQNRSLSNWVNINSVRLDYLFEKEGLVFLAYKKDSLIFWTSNSIAVPDDTLWFAKPFIKLGNTYAAIERKTSGHINTIGIIKVLDTYPYENKFLHNGFHKSFNVDDSHTLIIENENHNYPVKNEHGDYLFSLKKEIKEINNEVKVNFMTFLIIVSFIFLLLFGREIFKGKKFSFIKFLIFSSALIALRILIQWLHFPYFIYELEIFKPYYFALSEWIPSLGELLISTTLASYLIFVFYSKVELNKASTYNQLKQKLIIAGWIIVFIMYAWISYSIFRHLIIDSNFQFEAYDILNLSIPSFVGYFILLTLFSGFILLIDKACLQIKDSIQFKSVIKYQFILSLFAAIILIVLNNANAIITLVFSNFVIGYWVYIRLHYSPKYGMAVVLIALFSAFTTYFIRKENYKKQTEESKVIAVNQAREQDPVAEIVIGEAIGKIKSDSIIANYLEDEVFDFVSMSDYIRQKYFTGYLQRYNMQLTVCNKYDSVLLDEYQNVWDYCYGFFENMLEFDGVETNIQGLYYLKDPMGGINYFIKEKVELSGDWEAVTLFFELTARPHIEVLGYPELLLDKSFDAYYKDNGYCYAKYENNRLIERTGDFPYALNRDVYKAFDEEFSFFKQEKYNHVLFNSQPGHTIIVSYPKVHFYNLIISFTYIFFFFLLQISILLLLGNRFTHIIDFHYNIKNKIVFSMISILLISLFFVGGGTIMYTYNRFENTQIDILSEKLQSVLVEMEHKFSVYSNIHEVTPDYINALLVKFSNVFYSDINLYDIEGNLVGTSRQEIFERNLTSTKINSVAYRELVMNKKARVVQKEKIGSMEYYSAYIPFINHDNQLLAYLNLPYFTKQIVLRQELLRVVVAVINIYAFLLILSLVIAVYLSNRLTEPLRIVQQRIKNIQLSKKNERIDYDGNDEIADLVIEYNKMLDELDKSAKLLARSERESAWREMAQQIAHEIKNPLTPMKLNIQLLDKALKNNDADFKNRFERSSKTLIHQIDSLSAIATSFSQFAKMPKPKIDKVNIIERINRSTELFNDYTHVELERKYDQNSKIFVNADNDRMLQVFNNLMKNAIQSILSSTGGIVSVSVKQSKKSVVVKIKDNGSGISPEMEDKLFQPYFTTKTSGMGLGLAIVKNIVEEFSGAIWFESELGKGSSFFVSFPLFE